MTDAAAGRRPAAFLDRDGVLNIDRGFTHRVADLAFTPTALEALRLLRAADYLTVIVTNQSGVARGLYGPADVEAFNAALAAQAIAAGGRIDACYYCPYHPEGSVPAFAIAHEDRKPAPGMILKALADLPIARDGSFLIGDRPADAEAARAAGLPALIVASNEACDLAGAVRTMIARHAPGAATLCQSRGTML